MAVSPSRLTSRFMIGLVVAATLLPRTTFAAGEPDPVNAILLSTGSTLVPLGIAASLLTTGRGKDEGARFDASMAFTGIGSVLGPSVGQFYAGGGTNAWVTLGLRAVTGATMTAGLAIRLRGPEEDRALGNALFWVGLVPTALLGLYDIITAYGTARESKYRDAPIAGTGLTHDLISVAVCGPVPCSVQ